jgi:hypothetical protein
MAIYTWRRGAALDAVRATHDDTRRHTTTT